MFKYSVDCRILDEGVKEQERLVSIMLTGSDQDLDALAVDESLGPPCASGMRG